jgi:hypothetical protein
MEGDVERTSERVRLAAHRGGDRHVMSDAFRRAPIPASAS